MVNMKYEEWKRKTEELKWELEKLSYISPVLSDKHWETAEQDFKDFQEIFAEAGFSNGYLSAIENRYWPEAYEMSQLPWYEYHCKLGIITIGWRKRVISISWTSPHVRDEYYSIVETIKINIEDDVTKGYEKEFGYIHAWSREKAVEYLKEIRKAMEIFLQRQMKL